MAAAAARQRPERARAKLSIQYVLADTTLFGGTKVALHQANLMAARGHRVTVLAPAAPPDWYPLQASYRRLPALDAACLPAADVTVATFWATLAPAAAAARANGGEVVHYCQGFEASYDHNRDEHAAILDAYAQPLPAISVAPHLAELLRRRFGRPARVVPQPLEDFWRPRKWPLRRRPRAVPRILVPSPFEIEWKGVPTALAAVRLLRQQGLGCQVVRVSQWPLSDAERELLEPDEFHHHLRPVEVAALVRECDLALCPSREAEGFGLPALEAMACGVPVIASDVSCYRDFAADAARLVAVDSAADFARAAAEVLDHPALWRAMRRRGLRVAARFGERHAARVGEDALYWVAEGRWRGEASAATIAAAR
jgi:glycosyltransferase involved in cell wall biosynthesis